MSDSIGQLRQNWRSILVSGPQFYDRRLLMSITFTVKVQLWDENFMEIFISVRVCVENFLLEEWMLVCSNFQLLYERVSVLFIQICNCFKSWSEIFSCIGPYRFPVKDQSTFECISRHRFPVKDQSVF